MITDPPPSTYIAGDLNFPTKFGSKSAGFSPDPSGASLLRFSTPVPFPTMTAHDGGILTIPLLQSQPLLMMTHPSPLCLRTMLRKIYGNGFHGVLGVGPIGRPPRPRRLQTNLKHHRRGRRPIMRSGSCIFPPKNNTAFLAKMKLLYDTKLHDIYKDVDKDGVHLPPPCQQCPPRTKHSTRRCKRMHLMLKHYQVRG